MTRPPQRADEPAGVDRAAGDTQLGTLTVVGVGPGDPGLVTILGAERLARAPVLAHPVDAEGRSRARDTALAAISRLGGANATGPAPLPFHLPMSPDPAVAITAYDKAADEIAASLAAGDDVALACEGDPLLYGSAVQLIGRLADRFPVEVVPGIVSATAAAARLARPLAVREEVFAVIPGTLPADALRRAIDAADAFAVLKVGRHFDTIRAAIAHAGRLESADLLIEATRPEESIIPLAAAPAGPKPYFSLVLVGSPHPSADRAKAALAKGRAPPVRAATRSDPGPANPAEPARTIAVRPWIDPERPETATVAVLALGPSGLPAARAVVAALETAGLAAEVHALRQAGDEDGAVRFDNAAGHIGQLFAAGRAIVGVCAAGILVRAVAPHLADKRAEPPVIAVADDGSAVVPLLGAHRGGALMAAAIAEALGTRAAKTTAGDVRLGIALDLPPAGWTLANPADAKGVTAALLAGEAAEIDPALTFLDDHLPERRVGERLQLSASHAAADHGSADRLVYRPRRIAIGVGSERGCPPDHLADHAMAVLAEAGIAPESVACVASIDIKADEAAIHGLADRLGVPARFLTKAALAAEADRLANPSDIVAAAVGVPGVAEAAALSAAGPDGMLLVEKQKTARATVAIAAAPYPIDTGRVGRPRGRLAVVGTGPGAPAWRTAEQVALLKSADEWVGYGPYLDLVADLAGNRRQHRFPLGAEEARVRFGLERAGEGVSVALVSSGDPGIYAMAALVFELLDPAGTAPVSEAARRAEIIVSPGISASQAAAARLGAPFGHDFCLISLSDLLTPWETIEARLEAAARGDFVVALYNPRSERRRRQLPRALQILAAHRPAETPVAIATDVGRPAERIDTTTLSAVDPERVGMLSVVLVGASTSRAFDDGTGQARLYTPRGYAAKRATDAPGASQAPVGVTQNGATLAEETTP